MNKTKAQTLSEQKEAFTKYSVPRVLLKFILPAALSQLTFLILNLADAFFVGRTGDTFQISAMTITFPIVMILMYWYHIRRRRECEYGVGTGERKS